VKKNLLASYWNGIVEDKKGESYRNILRYFFPEFITALILYTALSWIDSYWVAALKSTTTYATHGTLNTILHAVLKFADGLMIGAIIIGGQFFGAKKSAEVGRTFVETFWVMSTMGLIASAILFFGSYPILCFYNASPAMIACGVPLMRIRALGILFMFVYFAFVAFLRSIKNTKTPMIIFVFGGLIFLFFDYVLIFGKWGFPNLGQLGSAWATVLQYGSMLILAIILVLFNSDYHKFNLNIFTYRPDIAAIKRLLSLSWPVVVDKSTMAIAYIWLGSIITGMGEYPAASFVVIKDLERALFLPAIAFAQVITFLASNDFGAKNTEGIKANIKKINLLASIFVLIILVISIYYKEFLIGLFDRNGAFTDFSAKAFPIISIFVFFDVLQIVLSGALRGVSDVKTVMWSRIAICAGFFVPASYLIKILPFGDNLLKFILIYGIFYLSNGLMSLIYVHRFRSGKWLKVEQEKV
jgi:MATE family multidrug resistance protein